MILSVSRRTDIPAFYGDWFMNRVREGYVCVRNPFNYSQVSKVNIEKDVVDCIVFWTKDPQNFVKHLDELDSRGYRYYFQITLTPYGRDIEKGIRDKSEVLHEVVKLARRLGPERVIVRYDPIILTEKYTMEYHIKAFGRLCSRLEGLVERVVISFIDEYKNITHIMRNYGFKVIKEEHMSFLGKNFGDIGEKHGIKIETCAEKIHLAQYGIDKGKCIDGDLIERVVGYNLKNKEKLDGAREGCKCMKCIDIGAYSSCLHGCVYCYANSGTTQVEGNYKSHRVDSEILLGELSKDEKAKVTVRKDAVSYKDDEHGYHQLELF